MARIALLLLIATLVLGGADPQTVSAGQELTEAQIESVFSGNVLRGTTDQGQPFTVSFQNDGKMFGRTGKYRDSGTWAIEGGKFCRQWSRWRNGSKACQTLKVDGDKYQLWDGNTLLSVFEPQ